MSLRKCPDHAGWSDSLSCYDCGRPTELGAEIDIFITEISSHPILTLMAVRQCDSEYFAVKLSSGQFHSLARIIRNHEQSVK